MANEFVRPKFKTKIIARNIIIFIDESNNEEYEMYYLFPLGSNLDTVVCPVLRNKQDHLPDKKSVDYALGLETKIRYVLKYTPAMLIEWFDKALLAILREEFKQEEVEYEWRMALYENN